MQPPQSTAPGASLGGVIAHLKERFGLTHVFMWHALLGFWAGVAPPGHGSEGAGTDKYQAQVRGCRLSTQQAACLGALHLGGGRHRQVPGPGE